MNKTTLLNRVACKNPNPCKLVTGKQGWRSDESTRLPPTWPGFDSRTLHHMLVEFVVGSRPCSERFFSGYSGFPISSETNISKFQFDLPTSPISYHNVRKQKGILQNSGAPMTKTPVSLPEEEGGGGGGGGEASQNLCSIISPLNWFHVFVN